MRRALAGVIAAAALAVCCPAAASASAAWTVKPVPLRAGETHGGLSGVACASVNSCTAVGQESPRSGTTGLALAEHWNGDIWSPKPAVDPAGATDSALAGVSCINGVTCTAVGSYVTTAGVLRTLAENWNGDAWMVQQSPSPGGANGSELLAVSCASASSCMATGDHATSSGGPVTLAEQWNGSRWAVQPTPSPGGAAGSELPGVSCASASDCTAVGYSGTGVLAEHWDGHAWAVQPAPSPPGESAALHQVSCSSASDCTATGSYVSSSGANAPLAEHWDGHAWTIQPTPLPAGALGGSLQGVWCVSASSCTAVGQYYKSASPTVSHALAEYWDGSTWSVQATAVPSGRKALESIACTSQHACTAVGVTPQLEVGTNLNHPLAEQEG